MNYKILEILKLSQKFNSITRKKFAQNNKPDGNPDGNYAYHVTFFKNLSSIDQNGLGPQGGTPSLGIGGVAGHSKGNLFLTEEGGIDFWFQRMSEHAEHQSDNAFEDELVPVVLRFPWPSNIIEDEAGSQDANADAFMTQSNIDPDDIQIYNGSSWVDISEWHTLDMESAFEIEEYEDEFTGELENLYYLINDSPFLP